MKYSHNFDEPMNINSVVENLGIYTILDGKSIDEVIATLQNLKAKYQGDFWFDIEGAGDVVLTLMATRKETVDEFQSRLQQFETHRKMSEHNERLEYERLKAKFEK